MEPWESLPIVKLFAHTQLSTPQVAVDQKADVDRIIAFCARVSNPDNQDNIETVDRLLGYLIRNKHWSPFEMVNVVLEVTTTRDIARQMLRHGFRFQEFSQRYANPVESLRFDLREPRYQDTKNRQNSLQLGSSTEEAVLEDAWYNKQLGLIEYAKMTYEWAIENGLAKEVARSVLPEGLTVSRLYVNGTIRNWIHYIEVRTDPTTQKEHRELARACAVEIAKVFPSINNFLPREIPDAPTK